MLYLRCELRRDTKGLQLLAVLDPKDPERAVGVVLTLCGPAEKVASGIRAMFDGAFVGCRLI